MPEELEAREAVRQAYQAFYRRLVAALYALTGDYSEAQDLVQEAYARALARPKVFLDVADPEAWLRTVAVNLARTRWRRRRLFDTLVRTGRVTRTPDSVPGADPNRVALVAALQQLSRPTREAIVLHHLADMSVYEVAEALGVPVGTVKARLSRGRNMLANLLSDRADERVTAARGEPVRGEPIRGEAAPGGTPRPDPPRADAPRARTARAGTVQRDETPIPAAVRGGAAPTGAHGDAMSSDGRGVAPGGALGGAVPTGARDGAVQAGALDGAVQAGAADGAVPTGAVPRPRRAGAHGPEWGLGGSHG